MRIESSVIYCTPQQMRVSYRCESGKIYRLYREARAPKLNIFCRTNQLEVYGDRAFQYPNQPANYDCPAQSLRTCCFKDTTLTAWQLNFEYFSTLLCSQDKTLNFLQPIFNN